MVEPDGTVLVEVRGVTKDFRGLRPLRIEHLTLRSYERLSIVGFDETEAELLVNLITGATLPDTGDVCVFGRRTADIVDGADWLRLVDRFGIVSSRVVLLDELTVAQNLAVPFTLEVDPVPDDVARDAEHLGEEVGLSESVFGERIRDMPPDLLVRIRLARALALDPFVLLLEHPSAALTGDEIPRLGATLARLAGRRQLGLLTLTADRQLAAAIGGRCERWNAATGAIAPESIWSRWRPRGLDRL